MNPDDPHKRTGEFALRIIKLVDALPSSSAEWEIGRQLLRSGTSVCANYLAARRARSRKEFLSKLGIVVEEADESKFWLDFIMSSELLSPRRARTLHVESLELVRIFAAMRRTARRKNVTKSPLHQITT